MKYYRTLLKIPEVEGISVQKRKDGTYVMYRHTEHVTEPEEKDVVRTCTIGKKKWEFFDRMYPNDNFRKFFPEDGQYLTDEIAFPSEFEVCPGIFVYCKRLAERTGLEDLLKTTFEDCWKEILDLAIYMVAQPHTGRNLDDYLDRSLLMTESWCDGEIITRRVREHVHVKDIRSFVTAWNRNNRNKNENVYIYTDTSFWKRIVRGMFSPSGFDNMLNPDIEGPKGPLPVLNFALGMRGSDGMPLFYTDTGFDAGVNIYEAACDLAQKHHAKHFTILLRDPEFSDETLEKLDSLGCGYAFEVRDKPELREKCVHTAEDDGLFYDYEGLPNGLCRSPERFFATIKTAYDSMDGWMYVYYNQDDEEAEQQNVKDELKDQKQEAEECLGKAADEMKCSPESMKYISFKWTEKGGRQVAESYEVNEEAVRFDDYMSGIECYFSTDEDGASQVTERLDDAANYSLLIESRCLNLRDPMNELNSDEDPDSDCWKARNNEVESFIKFIACILTSALRCAIDNTALTDYSANAMDPYDAVSELDIISATRTGRGRFRLDDSLNYKQKELFRAVGMSVEDVMNEINEAGQRFVAKNSV